jgi:CHRD domain
MRIQTLCSLMAAGLFAGVAACGNDISYPVLPAEEFTATLSGAAEVPAVPTAATGSAIFAVFDDSILSFRVDVAGLDSATAASIYAGGAGVAGPSLVSLFAGPSGCKQNSGAAIAITSSSAATPTTITTTVPHGFGAVGATPLVRIAGHAGSTPNINDEYTATVKGTSTFTIPVGVTVAGTGGTAQRFVFVNLTSPRCRPGYTGFLAQGEFKASQLTGLPAGYGATAQARLDSLLVLLRTGGAYVNVNNAVNSAGHIRGQIGPM